MIAWCIFRNSVAVDNSPAIYGWVRIGNREKSPLGDERSKPKDNSFVLAGLEVIFFVRTQR